MQVEEIHLQNTTLKRYDGIRIYYPNSKLLNEPIYNISRSANRWDAFKVPLFPSWDSYPFVDETQRE
jgi:small-conductance mechanosensitive channel